MAQCHSCKLQAGDSAEGEDPTSLPQMGCGSAAQMLGGILQCWQLLGGGSLVLCEPEPRWLSWDLVSELKQSVRELTAHEQRPALPLKPET